VVGTLTYDVPRRDSGTKRQRIEGRPPHRGRVSPRPPNAPTTLHTYEGPTQIAPSNRFAVVKLRFEIPHDFSLFAFTRGHPELAVLASASQRLPDGQCLAEVDIAGPRSSEFTEDLRRLSGIVSVARMGSIGPLTRYFVTLEAPSYLTVANKFRVLLRFPRFFQNGFFTVEAAGRVSQLKSMIQELRRLSPQVEVQRFGTNCMRAVPRSLSARQYDLLQKAVTAGYFEVPRRVSLTALARYLGRSKSTISRNLALIEKALAEASVANPG